MLVYHFSKEHVHACQLKIEENTLLQKQNPSQENALIPHLSSFKIHIWSTI